jgi:HEAT repeat protein
MNNQAPFNTSFSENQKQKDRQSEIALCAREIHSKNPHIRRQAAKRLGELKAEPESLLILLDDTNSYVRSAAAEALGNAAGEYRPEVIERLLAAIDDSNDYVCSAAVSSLGVLRAEAAFQQIQDCLTDDNPFVVQAAIISLARIAPSGIAETLAGFLDSENYLILLAATRAVSMLEYRPAGPKVLANLQNALTQHSERDIKLPKNYIQTLARLKVVEAVPTLMEIAQNVVGLRSAAVEALIELKADEAAPILAPLLNDPSNNLRRSLIEMMIEADYRAALPLIRTLLKDPAITIREEALAAINHWRDMASLDQVRWMCFQDPNPFVRPQAITCLVALINRDAIPDLVGLAHDRNSYVRQAVVNNLGKVGDLPPEAVEVLNFLAQDSQVKDAASSVLQAQGLEPEISPSPGASINDTHPTLPSELQPMSDELLSALLTWQATLARQVGLRTPEEILALDEALTTLIRALEENRQAPQN